MSKTATSYRLETLCRALVEHELGLVNLSQHGYATTEQGKGYMEDKIEELTRRINWIKGEITICEDELGIGVVIA
jgi:adenosyl cobinamide kinase/adenosyl cobinamide phosphate guanylyltransferase